MSKAEELAKKMQQGSQAVFTPRQSVEVKPIEKPEEPKPVKQATNKKVAKTAEVELATVFAKVPKDQKLWLDHRKIDTGQELGELLSEAIRLLQSKAQK